jgi:hypothetical protein
MALKLLRLAKAPASLGGGTKTLAYARGSDQSRERKRATQLSAGGGSQWR